MITIEKYEDKKHSKWLKLTLASQQPILLRFLLNTDQKRLLICSLQCLIDGIGIQTYFICQMAIFINIYNSDVISLLQILMKMAISIQNGFGHHAKQLIFKYIKGEFNSLSF